MANETKPTTTQAKPERYPCDGACYQGRFCAGPVVNGVPTTHGVCFRCGGKGYQTDADRKRNYGYDNYYRRVQI